MDNYLAIVEKTAIYQDGRMSREEVMSYASDIAFESGLSGESEQMLTGVIFQAITGEIYNESEWA